MIKLKLIYSFNIRMTKTIDEFYVKLGQIVDFEQKSSFFPGKVFIGEKYKRHFYFRKRGKAGDTEVYGRARTLKKYKILKVRITPKVEKFSYPIIMFTAGIIGVISLSIVQGEIGILFFLFVLLALILINYLRLIYGLKKLGEEVKSVLKINV